MCLTIQDAEEQFLDDEGDDYAGDDFLVNIGYVFNESAQLWINRDDLPENISSMDYADADLSNL